MENNTVTTLENMYSNNFICRFNNPSGIPSWTIKNISKIHIAKNSDGSYFYDSIRVFLYNTVQYNVIKILLETISREQKVEMFIDDIDKTGKIVSTMSIIGYITDIYTDERNYESIEPTMITVIIKPIIITVE